MLSSQEIKFHKNFRIKRYAFPNVENGDRIDNGRSLLMILKQINLPELLNLIELKCFYFHKRNQNIWF